MQSGSFLEKFSSNLLKSVSYRNYEFKKAFSFLERYNKILDVGCGQGTFLEKDPKKIYGIDINPESVDICLKKGLNVKVGSALKIPFEDNTFDGLHCSHVIQIFNYVDALSLLREARRVVKPNGIIVITSFPDHKRLFFTSETLRAYPPQAIRVLIKQRDETFGDPTTTDHPLLKQEDIWLRRSALFEFTGPRNETTSQIAIMLNLLQHKVFLRKYWSYNGYVMKLRNSGQNRIF